MSHKTKRPPPTQTRHVPPQAQQLGTGDIAVTVRVTLAGITPPIWRHLQLSGAMTLQDLHFAIQGAFGWENCHRHVFILSADEHYAVSSDHSWNTDAEVEWAQDASKITLQAIVARNIKRWTYEYDFGDSWLHEITIETASLSPKPLAMPRCLAGERNAPPEDCGGVLGYYHFVEAMADPKHPEHRDLKEWYGGKYKPELFNIKAANDAIEFYREPAQWS